MPNLIGGFFVFLIGQIKQKLGQPKNNNLKICPFSIIIINK